MAEELNIEPVDAEPSADIDWNDTDALADYFAGDVEGDQEPAQADSDADGDVEGDPVEADPAADDVVEVMPEGWDAEMWAGVAPAVQHRINEQIKAHADAIAAERKAQQELTAAKEAYEAQTNAQLQNALGVMRRIVEGEFGQVDWQSLANSDPASYVRLQQMYKERMQAVQAMEQNVTERVRQQRAAIAEQERKAIDNEFEQVLPKVQALVGAGFEKKAFAGELAQYLVGVGVPQEAVSQMSRGYEVELAAKAMLFDRMMTNRAQAAKKLADAPKVQAPRGAASADNGGRLARAKSALNKNPNSTEALADLFAAM